MLREEKGKYVIEYNLENTKHTRTSRGGRRLEGGPDTLIKVVINSN